MLNKVPEVTVWFWIIKILCTTVGESFADWINGSLGFGLIGTAVLFTGVLAVVGVAQFRLDRYVPFVYWLTVVVVSVAGTLYTDILTDQEHVPLRISSAVFAVGLAAVFAIWYARERTLSVHSINTPAREGFYWLAVLVTFALGTATGDWTVELTGWGPGTSVLLPAALIAAVMIGWKAGAGPVLTFWLAYILTRPLGANLGDFFASPRSEHGLGVGTAGTSFVFLAAIGLTVAYLSFSRADVTESNGRSVSPLLTTPVVALQRQRAAVAGLAVVAVATAGLLTYTSRQPHLVISDDGPATPAVAEPVVADPAAPPAQAPASGTTGASDQTAAAGVGKFASTDLTGFKQIAQDALGMVEATAQSAAVTRIKDLETSWDHAQAKLQAKDPTTWKLLDGKIDVVLNELRAKQPNPTYEKTALNNLLNALG
jgi:uncharacterized membrane-anchored protein